MQDLDLNKADIAPVSAPSNTGGGRVEHGQPRTGHKYVRRQLSEDGSHFIYTYAGDAHPQAHGHEHVLTSDHTLDVPGHVDTAATHPQEAYSHSRRSLVPKPGEPPRTIPIKHPVTGEDINMHVFGRHDEQKGLVPKIILQHPDGRYVEGAPGISDKKKKPDPFAAQSFAAVERWIDSSIRNKDNPKFVDDEGKEPLKLRNVSGKVNAKNDEYIPPSNKQKGGASPYALDFLAGGVHHKLDDEKSKGANSLYFKSPELREKAARSYLQHHRLIKQTQMGNRPLLSDIIESDDTAINSIQGDKLPWALGKNRTRILSGSPEEKDTFIQKLYHESGGALFQSANKLLRRRNLDPKLSQRILGPDYENLGRGDITTALHPTTLAYQALSDAVDSYNPQGKKPFLDYLDAQLRYVTSKWLLEDNPQLQNWGRAGVKINEDDRQDALTTLIDNDTAKYGHEITEDAQNALMDYKKEKENEVVPSADIEAWRGKAVKRLQQWAQKYPKLAPETNIMIQHTQNIRDEADLMQRDQYMHEHANERAKKDPTFPKNEFILSVINDPDEEDEEEQQPEQKRRMGKAIEYIIEENKIVDYIKEVMPEVVAKAAAELPVNPPKYSHKEGSKEYPKFYYNDSKGNYIRHTNAPSGHPDASRGGDAEIHPNEPVFESNPEYFTPDGRKLSRAPYPGAPVEWNQSYHPNDSKNLWVGRWVNPVSGAHEYSYLDADLRNNPKLNIHRQNVIVSVVIPRLRKYIFGLFRSEQIKDQVTAVMLSLLDQGRCRIDDLNYLMYIEIRGDLVDIGNREVHVDARITQILSVLSQNPSPVGSIFSIPKVKADGSYDLDNVRRLGKHYISGILDSFGISPEALQSYHATQTYSVEMHKLLNEGMSYDAAHHMALVEVAHDMGHPLEGAEDVTQALMAINELLIDPVLASAIQKNAAEIGLGNIELATITKPIYPAVPHVSSDLADLTDSEKEFASWLHTAEIHEHV